MYISLQIPHTEYIEHGSRIAEGNFIIYQLYSVQRHLIQINE